MTTRKKTETGRRKCPPLQGDTLADLVAGYIATNRPANRNYETRFRRLSSVRESIDMAARSVFCGKVHDHQRRIGRAKLRRAAVLLRNAESELKACKDFDQLHNVVREAVLKRRGYGNLYVYDVATRIGWFMGIRPKMVYLHAGTREGARNLGFGGRGATLDPSLLPVELREKLAPAEIEDVLCICRHKFPRLRIKS